jgi:hypothetical protein
MSLSRARWSLESDAQIDIAKLKDNADCHNPYAIPFGL